MLPRGEKRLSVSQMCTKLKEVFGIRRSRSTVTNWIKVGVVAVRGSGRRIKLEHTHVGGCYHSSLEAYERFEAKKDEVRE